MNDNDFFELLRKKFGILPPGEYDQDWEFTVGNSEDTEKYIEFYNDYSLTLSQKYSMINMIIQGFEDLLAFSEEWDRLDKIRDEVKKILLSEKSMHIDTIKYWALLDTESEEDRFYVSKFMRELLIRHPE